MLQWARYFLRNLNQRAELNFLWEYFVPAQPPHSLTFPLTPLLFSNKCVKILFFASSIHFPPALLITIPYQIYIYTSTFHPSINQTKLTYFPYTPYLTCHSTPISISPFTFLSRASPPPTNFNSFSNFLFYLNPLFENFSRIILHYSPFLFPRRHQQSNPTIEG